MKKLSVTDIQQLMLNVGTPSKEIDHVIEKSLNNRLISYYNVIPPLLAFSLFKDGTHGSKPWANAVDEQIKKVTNEQAPTAMISPVRRQSP